MARDDDDLALHDFHVDALEGMEMAVPLMHVFAMMIGSVLRLGRS